MNKQRLLNVAKACRESPNPEAFTMRKVHYCGTPACALGHYAARRDLQQMFQLPTREALDFNRDRGPLQVYLGSCSIIVGAWGATSPSGALFVHAQHHFGITAAQAEDLFSSRGCGNARTPIEAAKYIERFVEQL